MRHSICWGGLLLVVICSVATIGFASILAQEARTGILYGLSVLQLILAAPAYVWLRRKNSNNESRNVSLDLRSQGLVIGVCLLVLILAIVSIIYLTVKADMPMPSFGQIVWLIFYQFVLIALTEEILFRGISFALMPQGSWQALIFSSLLFSLYHWNNGLVTLPYYLAMGLIFGVLRYFSVSLLVLAIGHGLFNLVLELAWPISGFYFGSTAFYIVMPLVFLCLAALAGWMLSAIQQQRQGVIIKAYN